jgi:prolyl oligopeptidase
MNTISAVAPLSPETTSAPTYPTARKVEQTDDYFGTTVNDPYRWMEDVDSAELKTWVDAENELTQSYLAEVPSRVKMQKRLMELINFERYTAPARRGTRYFYSHNSGLQNQNVIYWQEGLEGEPKVLLDPNTFSTDGTVAISGLSITDDGSLAAYSIADAGSDWVKWHVRDVASGKDLPDVVEWSKFSGASWMKDGSGFFYARYDAPAADASEAEALKTANYFHKVYFHKSGTPQREDKLIFDRPDDGELNLGAQVTDDGRYLVLHQSKGTSPNNELSVKDLQRPDAPIMRLI